MVRCPDPHQQGFLEFLLLHQNQLVRVANVHLVHLVHPRISQDQLAPEGDVQDAHGDHVQDVHLVHADSHVPEDHVQDAHGDHVQDVHLVHADSHVPGDHVPEGHVPEDHVHEDHVREDHVHGDHVLEDHVQVQDQLLPGHLHLLH